MKSLNPITRTLTMAAIVAALLGTLAGVALADGDTIISSTATDAFEDDNTPAQAGVLPLDGTAQARNFGAAGDVDWAVVTVEAGVLYVFTAAADGDSPALPRLALYAADDTETALAHGRPSSAGGTGIVWVAPTSGVYYLHISEANGHGDATHTYTLQGEAFASLLALRNATR